MTADGDTRAHDGQRDGDAPNATAVRTGAHENARDVVAGVDRWARAELRRLLELERAERVTKSPNPAFNPYSTLGGSPDG